MEHGTFEPTAYSLAMIQRYLLWQRMGIAGPQTVRDMDAFAQLSKMESGMNA